MARKINMVSIFWVSDGLTNCRTHRHNVPVTKALNRDILAAEKERKKRRKEEEEEVPYMV